MRFSSGFVAMLVAVAVLPVRAQAEDAATVLSSVVEIETFVPGEARTAGILGTERQGTGLIIDDSGLVLTIGYLVLEAIEGEITGEDGKTVPAEIVAYDYNTNFGLLRALGEISGEPIKFGDSSKTRLSDNFLAVSFGGVGQITPVFVASRQQFAGFWEFLVDDAIYTAPRHTWIAGAGLIGEDGRLYGVGFGQVADAAPDSRFLPGNMFIPVNLLKPILADLIAHGRDTTPPHPWLGIYTREWGDELQVFSVAADSPGEAAGVAAGDEIIAIAGQPVHSMADFFQKLWALGSAGTVVDLTVRRDDVNRDITITSADRYDWLHLTPTY